MKSFATEMLYDAPRAAKGLIKGILSPKVLWVNGRKYAGGCLGLWKCLSMGGSSSPHGLVPKGAELMMPASSLGPRRG